MKASIENVYFSVTLSQKLSHFSIQSFLWGWAVVLGIALLDTLWVSHSQLIFPIGLMPWMAFAPLLLFLNVKLLCLLLPAADFPSLRPIVMFSQKNAIGVRFFLAGEYVALVAGTCFALCFLSYLIFTWPFPLVDQKLSDLDGAIGFNWQRWYRWSQSPPIYITLLLAYCSILPQFVFFAFWFAFLLRKERLYEIYWILFFALATTMIIAGLLPSVGPAFLVNWTPAEQPMIKNAFDKAMTTLMAIRSETPLDFESHKLTGLVTFPSFHSVCAIVYCYGFRRTGLLGFVINIMNVLMLISIPFLGNHYIVDVIAGIAIALASIMLVRIFNGHFRPQQP